MRVIYNSRLFKLMKKARLVGPRYTAITLAEWVLTDRTTMDDLTFHHERRHIHQWRWCGYLLFPPIYFALMGYAALVAWIRGGGWYRYHPLEIDAWNYAERKANPFTSFEVLKR